MDFSTKVAVFLIQFSSLIVAIAIFFIEIDIPFTHHLWIDSLSL